MTMSWIDVFLAFSLGTLFGVTVMSLMRGGRDGK